jgi:hypothetical protein
MCTRTIFFTETTAGLSQPEQYISTKMPMRLYSLYKIDSNEPEFTRDTREEKKKGKHTHQQYTRLRGKGVSENLRRQLIEEKTHHDPSTAITRNSTGHGSGRDRPAHGIAGVIEQL